jgi:hypothetical protein
MGIGRLAGAIWDNPYTRAWQGGVGRAVVDPIERRFVKDVDPERIRNDVYARYPLGEDRVISPELAKVLDARVGPGSGAALQEVVAGAPGELQVARDVQAGRVRQLAVALNPDSRVNLAYDVHLPAEGFTGAGNFLRQFSLGSNVGAYAVPGAGAALAIKGAMDVVARMQAGEPVSKEEAAAAGQVLAEVSSRNSALSPSGVA